MNRMSIIFVLAFAVTLSAVFTLAANQQQIQQQEQIYGSRLMTQQEREEYRLQLLNAKTTQERNQIREEHQERMKARAQAQGVTLPVDPPGQGGGMSSRGGGMGSGGGTGAGGSR